MIQRTWKALTVIGGILAAGAAGGTWAYDLQSEVAANTTERHVQAYDRLLRKLRQERGLSPRDLARFCLAARHLKIRHPLCK